MGKLKYVMHFDGSSKPNPGDMISAYIIEDENNHVLFAETIKSGNGTSNRAEYIGLYSGIKKAKELGFVNLDILGDSELIINQVKGNCRCTKPPLRYYRDRIRNLLKEFDSWSLTHVLRNENKKADKLCRAELPSIIIGERPITENPITEDQRIPLIRLLARRGRRLLTSGLQLNWLEFSEAVKKAEKYLDEIDH